MHRATTTPKQRWRPAASGPPAGPLPWFLDRTERSLGRRTVDDTIRPITLADIHGASSRIAGTVLRTPLVRLDTGPDYPEIWLKLENLQPTNSYKLRGA